MNLLKIRLSLSIYILQVYLPLPIADRIHKNQDFREEKDKFLAVMTELDLLPNATLNEIFNEIHSIFWTTLENDDGFQEAVKFLISYKWNNMLKTLEEHPAYKELNGLLLKNNLYDLNKKIDLKDIKTLLPSENVGRADFGMLMVNLRPWFRVARLVNFYLVVRNSEFYRNLHRSNDKDAIMEAFDKVLDLEITEKMFRILRKMNLDTDLLVRVLQFMLDLDQDFW